MCIWWPMAAASLTEANVLKGFEWYAKSRAAGGSVAGNVTLMYELRSSTTDHIAMDDTAYPRMPGMRHVILLGTGADNDASPEVRELAQKLLLEGPGMILNKENAVKSNVVPNGIEHFHDMREVYGAHYGRLQKIKRKYDPKNKLPGPISAHDGAKYGEREPAQI